MAELRLRVRRNELAVERLREPLVHLRLVGVVDDRRQRHAEVQSVRMAVDAAHQSGAINERVAVRTA